jgi:hypothetical protein
VVDQEGEYLCANCRSAAGARRTPGGSGEPLGVIEAIGLGWTLVTRDFWPVWLLGLVFVLLQGVGNVLGAIPYIGIVFSMIIAIAVTPALQAGLVHAVLRKMDGAAADPADIFEGFKTRYGDSIVVMLPIWGAFAVMGAVAVIGLIVVMYAAGGRDPGHNPVIILILVLVGIVAIFLSMLLNSVMWLAYVALWDTHDSGWAAFIAGGRIVMANFLPTCGVMLLFFVFILGAVILGMLALCIGLLFTMPFVMVWMTATYAYLYRSWQASVSA